MQSILAHWGSRIPLGSCPRFVGIPLAAAAATASVLGRFPGPSRFANRGQQRVVVGQYLIQAASDIFLGWVRITDLDGELRDYYVRLFHDWKGGLDIEAMSPAGAVLRGRRGAGGGGVMAQVRKLP